jgi:Mrp family chromosome partitioning ATPase
MITVSSLSSGEGKTFITEKLGRLLAGYGKRVLLIDMNFKSPKLKQIFTAPEENNKQIKGIPETQINKIGTENLDFVFLAGEGEQMKSTLLFAPQTATFLNEMKSNYDVVLIDTAATDSKIDAAAVMGLSDLNLMVFRKGKSRIRNLKKCKSFLDSYKIKNVQFVLNG